MKVRVIPHGNIFVWKEFIDDDSIDDDVMPGLPSDWRLEFNDEMKCLHFHLQFFELERIGIPL